MATHRKQRGRTAPNYKEALETLTGYSNMYLEEYLKKEEPLVDGYINNNINRAKASLENLLNKADLYEHYSKKYNELLEKYELKEEELENVLELVRKLPIKPYCHSIDDIRDSYWLCCPTCNEVIAYGSYIDDTEIKIPDKCPYCSQLLRNEVEDD